MKRIISIALALLLLLSAWPWQGIMALVVIVPETTAVDEIEYAINDEDLPLEFQDMPEPVLLRRGSVPPTVFAQQDRRWGTNQYGYSNYAGTTPATISSGGCGILALVNAVYYMNGNYIDPKFLAKWSVDNGCRKNGVGTKHELYPLFSQAYGTTYGFYCENSTGISSWDTLAQHLLDGNTAIVPVSTIATGSGHLMAIVDYDTSTSKYLVLDSYKSPNRGTSPDGYAWLTKSEFKRKMSCSKFILLYDRSCDHTYSAGHCTKCGALQPLQKDSIYVREGIYTTIATGYAYLRRDPYETGVNFSNNLLKSFPYNRQEVIVTGGVVNGKGETWYKVTFGSLSGYIKSGQISFTREITAEVTHGYFSVPSNHKVGTGFHISGTITGINCKITKIRAYFVDDNTDSVVSNSTTSWYSVNKDVFELYNSSVDNALRFGKLSAGSYHYRIEIETDREVNGKTTHSFRSESFAVGNATVVAPTIYESDRSFGKRIITIDGVGTTQYRINGGAWITGSTITVDNSCTIEAKSVYNGRSSGISKLCVSMPVVADPSISSTLTPSGATVTINGDETSTVFYRIDNGSYQEYTGSFTLSQTAIIEAYAEKPGYLVSGSVSGTITVSAPQTPVVVRDTSADIAEGTAITVHWGNDALASSYIVTVKKDGTEWKTETVTAAQYSFATSGAGRYEVSVVAKNVIGSSAVSNTVSTTAHDPSTVTFKDWDGTVLSTQSVAYGSAATKPMTPARRGYTFSGWDKSYSNVTTDLTVTAEYEINVYTVTFYDVDGAKKIATQSITFNEAIDSAAVEALVNVENGGRVFGGWYIFDADDESERDLEHIDSNMKLRAVTVWGNEDLPVFVDNISAILCYDSNNGMFNGYTVSCRVSTADAKDINAKIIVTLLAVTDEETGACKMINTKIDTINLTTSSSNATWSGDILCDGTSGADYVEISVVSVEGNDRTGGLISETKRYAITSEATQFWSEWMTAEELASFGHSTTDSTVEGKTQYSERTNTKNTVTSASATPPEGYALLKDNSHWGDWSGWSDTPVAKTDTRDVDTQTVSVPQGYTEYRYGSWYNGSKSYFCGATYSGSWLRYTDWSTQRYSKAKPDNAWACGNYNHHLNGYHPGYTYYDGSRFFWTQYNIGGKNYYWEESRYIDTSYNKTQYRYRDWISSFTYYKWDYGNWTDWTDDVLTDNDLSDPSYEVQTRELYRYVVFDASQIQPNTSGTTQTISGRLEEANTNLEGRLATVFVYKSLNSDPTESQLEYIGQTALGADGTYSFTFTTKEDVSEETGDFVVALAVEGGNGLINVGMVKYDRPTYTVTFATENGTISTQEVEEGCSASVPEAPEMEGYTFTGWNRSTTNVTRNMTVVAQYKPMDCCVVFVDYLNQECELRHVDYGTVLTIPEGMENPSHEGYTFTGWSFGSDATVKGDMIVSALWEIETYTVTFYDETGSVEISTQVVPYGGFATPPADLEVDSDKVFLAWSDDNPWWNVTSNVSVYPIVVYKETTAAPASNLFEITEGLYEELTLTSEDGATILYTLDGSEPIMPHEDISAEGTTFIYSEPLTLTEDTFVRAKAVREGKNDSDITEVVFIYAEELGNYNDWGEAVDLKTQNVSVSEFDSVSIRVDLTSNPQLAGYGFYIKADPSVFYVDFDRTTLESTAASGTLCADGGSLLVKNYDEVLGWHVLWTGDASSLVSGSLLNLTLVAGAEITSGAYPVTVGYTTGDTFGSDNEPESVTAIANVTITASVHEHRYEETTTSATCTSPGNTTYICEVCGESYSEPIAALGHDYNYTVTTDPTTTAAGKLQGACSRCSTTSSITLPRLSTTDYTYQITQAATCSATGTGTYTWKVTTYGEFFFDVTLPVGEHNYANGYCTVCGEIDPNYTEAKLVISALPVTAVQGATIRVPVLISGEGSFAGFTFSISATEGLILTNIEKGALLKTADGSLMKNTAAGYANFTNTENIDGNGELLVLTLTVSDEAAEGTQQTITIQLKDNKATNFVDETSSPVAVRFEPIVVNVSAVILGDVDGDGDITTADAVRLVRYLVDLEDLTEQQKLAADVSHDNDITSADSIKLVRYLVGLEDSLDPNRRVQRIGAASAAVVAAESVSGKKGETVTVPVMISGNPGFAGFTFEVGYPDAVELIKITAAPILKDAEGGSLSCNLDKGLINWTNTGNITEDGELFYLTFRILKEEKEPADIELRVKDDKESNFVDETGRSIILNHFKDMPEKNTWAYDAINWALANKITGGTTATTFSPEAGCTRAQVVTFLWRAAGEPEPTATRNPFKDVAEDAYYYKAVLWAAENGIAAGISTTIFSPDAVCTRGQIVTFIWRYEGSPETRELNTSFDDVKAGAYYEEAVLWAYEAGITAGTSTTAFSPNATCTRAQIVTFLYRDAMMNK